MHPPAHASNHVFHHHRARRAARNKLQDCFGDATRLGAKLGDGDGFPVSTAQKRSECHKVGRRPVFAVDDGVIRQDADAHFHLIGSDKAAEKQVLQQDGFGIHEARLRAGGVEDEVAFEALIAAQ